MIFVVVLDKMWRKLPAENPAIFQESLQAAYRLMEVSRSETKSYRN
jgi:hypothetical protein